jgi:hypothetical protein
MWATTTKPALIGLSMEQPSTHSFTASIWVRRWSGYRSNSGCLAVKMQARLSSQGRRGEAGCCIVCTRNARWMVYTQSKLNGVHSMQAVLCVHSMQANWCTQCKLNGVHAMQAEWCVHAMQAVLCVHSMQAELCTRNASWMVKVNASLG